MKQAILKKHRILKILLIVLMLISLGLYLNRGWIRRSVVPSITYHIYGKQIDDAYAASMLPVNNELARIGQRLTIIDGTRRDKAKCFDGNFHYFRETVICDVGPSFKDESVSPSFRQAWPAESTRLSTILQARGWRFDNNYPNYSTHLEKLFDDSQPQVNVGYAKQIGKVACTLYFRYDPPFEQTAPSFQVNEYCGIEQNFFGGY